MFMWCPVASNLYKRLMGREYDHIQTSSRGPPKQRRGLFKMLKLFCLFHDCFSFQNAQESEIIP